MVDVEQLASQYIDGKLSGLELSQMVDRNELTKSERRKVVKISEKLKKKQSTEITDLTARQKLRLQVKEKKSLPKLSKEDRRKKFQKDLDSEREKESANFTICLGCKKRGHFVKNCPKLDMCLPAVVNSSDEGVCFNCGSREHILKNCDKERSKDSKYGGKSNGPTSLPYAVCFICKQVGHIARDCPENANGLYPKGGCCHICLQKDHLVKDCPERTEEDKLRHLNRKREEDEKLNGVCVPGLLSDDYTDLGGDAIILPDDGDGDGDGVDDGEEGDAGEERKKKGKKRQQQDDARPSTSKSKKKKSKVN